jgi:hypothetical protein
MMITLAWTHHLYFEGLSAVEDWILFARAVQLSSFVVFCVDDDIYSLLSIKEPANVIKMPHSFVYQSSLPRKANITLSLMHRDPKMELVPLLGRWILDLGITAVYIDPEVVLLRNPLPALLLAYSRADFSTQVEGRLVESTPRECNALYSEDRMLWGLYSTGGTKLTPDLFILSPDPRKKNRQLLDRWIAILRSREDISGKTAFHEAIVFAQKDLGINFQTLDCSLFPNAYRYFTVGSWWRHQQPYPPVLVNLKGLRDKQVLLSSLRADRDAAAALLHRPVEQMTTSDATKTMVKGSGGAMSRRLEATTRPLGSSTGSIISSTGSISSSTGSIISSTGNKGSIISSTGNKGSIISSTGNKGSKGGRSKGLLLLGSGPYPRPLNDSCRIWSRSSPLDSSLSPGRQQQQQQQPSLSSLYVHQAPRFIHIDHKFAKALSHAFDVYSLAVSMALHYNLTVVYEPLMLLPMSSIIPNEMEAAAERKNSSSLGNKPLLPTLSLDWLGLHKNAVSPSDLDRLYTAEELVIAEINPPCSSSSSRLTHNRSSSLSPFLQQPQRPGKVMDSRTIKINLENILSSADPHRPLLIRGCGYSLSYKPVSGDPARVVRYLRSQMDPSWGGSRSNGSSGHSRVGAESSDGLELGDHRVIAVHIRRGDYLQQPQLTASSSPASSAAASVALGGGILSDAYYADTVCKLLQLLGRDRVNRFVVLSEGSRSGLYVDETGQPSDLRRKVEARCPFYSTTTSTSTSSTTTTSSVTTTSTTTKEAEAEGGGSSQHQQVLRWDMQFLLGDRSASVMETLQIMVGASVLITSKSRLSKMAATYSQGLVVVPSSIFNSYKGIPSIISAPDIVNHKVRRCTYCLPVFTADILFGTTTTICDRSNGCMNNE